MKLFLVLTVHQCIHFFLNEAELKISRIFRDVMKRWILGKLVWLNAA